MILFLFISSALSSCTGPDRAMDSHCKLRDEKSCSKPCYWQPPPQAAPKSPTWYYNITKMGEPLHEKNTVDIACSVSCLHCLPTGQKKLELWTGGKLYRQGAVFHFPASWNHSYYAAVECKADPAYENLAGCRTRPENEVQGFDDPHLCKRQPTRITCDEKKECIWHGADLFDMETGCIGTKNENAGWVFIIFAFVIVGMLGVMIFHSDILEAVFEKKMDALMILFVQALMFFSSCWGLYSALNISATLGCLFNAIEHAVFTDCYDKIKGIKFASDMMLAGSICSIIASIIIAFLHSFGLQELVDKEAATKYRIPESVILHFSKFALFAGCITGLRDVHDDGFWGSGCAGEFQIASEEQGSRFLSALLMTIFAIIFDFVLCGWSSYKSTSEDKTLDDVEEQNDQENCCENTL